MQIKDYYSILEIQPSSTTDEIKKAYRRLAHHYHPDKNDGDPYAAAQFALIKEAYETLTNPVRKDHYLQQRWYAQSQGRVRQQMALTPVTLLTQLLELDRYVSRLDIHRMDHQSLATHLAELLSPDTIEMVRSFNEVEVNKQIVKTTLSICALLPYQYSEKLLLPLTKIRVDEMTTRDIQHLFSRQAGAARWEKQKVWIVVLLVAAICTLIAIVA